MSLAPGQEGNDFIAREHERRQLIAITHDVADTGGTLDRDPRRLQIGDVAVDGAFGDFQPFGQLTCPDEPAAAQVLHDLEQAVGASHAASSFRSWRAALLPSGRKQADRIAVRIDTIGKSACREWRPDRK